MSIAALKSAINTSIRTASGAGSITKTIDANLRDDVVEEIALKGIAYVGSPGELANLDGTEFRAAIVGHTEDGGIYVFDPSSSGGDRHEEATGGGYWNRLGLNVFESIKKTTPGNYVNEVINFANNTPKLETDPTANDELVHKQYVDGMPFTTITPVAGSGTIDADVSLRHTITLTGNTSITVSNSTDGESGILNVLQDGSGGHLLALIGTGLPSADGFDTTASARTVYLWMNIGGTVFWAGLSYNSISLHVEEANPHEQYSLIDTPITSGTSVAYTADRIYGQADAPETGNITESLTGALDGVTILIFHNAGSEPTYPGTWNLLAGTYANSDLNIYHATHIDGAVYYTISQIQ